MPEPQSLCDEVIIVTTITPVNDEPVIEESDEEVSEDTDEDAPVNICLDVEDVGPGFNLISSDIVSNTGNGEFEFGEGICFTFIPDEDVFGDESAIVTVCDSGDPELCDDILVNININAVNDPPIAVDDEVTVLRNRSISANVLENDSDIEGNNLFVNLPLEAMPLHGTLEIDDRGNFTYTPDPAFFRR